MRSQYPPYFDPRRLGKELREVSSDLVHSESGDLVGRRFTGPEEIDFYIWTDKNKRIIKQQITFFGQVVEWNLVEGNKTGLVVETENQAREAVHFDETSQLRAVAHAMEMVQNAPALEKERTQILVNFIRGQKARDLKTAQFLDQFRPAEERSAPGFLKKLWSWLF